MFVANGDGFQGVHLHQGFVRLVEYAEELQGLWRSQAGDELSLALSRGGSLVGIFRPHDAQGTVQHPVAGHAHGGCLAFSAPFPEVSAVVGWLGMFRVDRDGPRLDLARHLLTATDEGNRRFIPETYRRADAEAPASVLMRLQTTSAQRLADSRGA